MLSRSSTVAVVVIPVVVICRYRFEHLLLLLMSSRSRQVIQIVNYCGYSQELVAWPDADGYWALVPIVELVANRQRAGEAPEHPSS
jgi:hypothetical protein